MEQEIPEQKLGWKESLNRKRTVVSLTVLAGLLAFWGLGNNDFWDDEAFTAVYGRNLMETGQIVGWDGRNLMAYGMLGWVNEDMINTHSPPLQYLVAGLSQKIFGDSAAGGRTLFVLIGLFSIPLMAAWFKHEFDSDEYWMVALILALSVPYLLYIRQLRYYALGLTFFAGLLWVWAALPRARQYRWWILLGTLFLCLLVLSQYLYAAAAVAVITISLLRERYRNRKNLIFLAVIILVGVVAATWVGLRNDHVMGQVLESGITDHVSKFFRLMFMVPRDAVRFEFFPVGMLFFGAVGAALLGRAEVNHLKSILLTLAYGMGIIVAVSLVSLQTPDSTASDTDMRYYVLLIPLSAAVAARIYELLCKTRFRGLPELFLIILLSSNVLTFNFFGRMGLHSRLVQYVGEVMNDYTTGSEAISKFIQEEISHDDCIFIIPTALNTIQIHHNPEHKFCGLLTNQAPFAKKHAAELRADLFWENTVPDYVIVGGRSPERSSQLLATLYGEGGFELEAVIPVLWANLTRPEIPWRIFAPIEIDNPFTQGVLIFHRTSQPTHLPTVGALEIEKYIHF
ncbi:MAG: glycosyltransferase family 39 protein [Acidobacteria bacterium]|nr:glycosyltransferase family 39 protein [Acidobacteriota bacterium]